MNLNISILFLKRTSSQFLFPDKIMIYPCLETTTKLYSSLMTYVLFDILQYSQNHFRLRYLIYVFMTITFLTSIKLTEI